MRIVINPIGEIETAYNTANFFTGFALAVTYFEYDVNHILGMFFQERISRKTIERLSLTLKIKIVFGLDLIEEKAYRKILEIINTRNRLIHPTDKMDKEGRSHDIVLRFRLNEKEKSSLRGFKECYCSLGQAYSGLFEKKQEVVTKP